MYLSKIIVNNFRSFGSLEIPFQPKINVLVGENNGGKSNAIDATRIVTLPLSGRREIYCEDTDVRFGSEKGERRFSIEAEFAGLNPAQQGRLLTAATDHTLRTARFGLSYEEKGRRPKIWAGSVEGTPEPGIMDRIRHVYLPPLRDAKRALASGNPTRILALLNHFLGEGEDDELARALQRKAEHNVLQQVDGAVDIGLEALTAGVRRQTASLGFAEDEKLIEIARDLRFKLADHGIAPEDLRYSGHGFANLLYMATIAVQLEKVDDVDLTLFLVEEPEAHLHPQLQAAVLGFLKEKAEESRKKEGGDGLGEIQIIIASHSPNLTAWIENKNIIHFRSSEAGDTQRKEADAAIEERPADDKDAHVPRRVSRCIPLKDIPLSDPERRKIDRYLDVTKSSLLFGSRVLLVEGMAETLLLPVMAERFVLNGENKDQKLRLFQSTAFVSIDGIDFEPYVKLLLQKYNGVSIADLVGVITDGDRKKLEDGEVVSPGNSRKQKLEGIAQGFGRKDKLHVFVNTYSLETELYNAGNKDLLKAVYAELHPRSGEKWDQATAKTGDEFAKAFQELFEDTRKGDFAQILAEKLINEKDFKVPGYLEQAIKSLAE